MRSMPSRPPYLLLGLVIACAAQADGASPDRCQPAFQAGDFTAAADCYQSVLKRSPDDPAANLQAGALALYANDLDSATRHLKAAQGHGLDEGRIARLLAAADARRPAPGLFQIRMEGDVVRLPFAYTDPLPILKVRVNGSHDAYFVMDTGAGHVVLDPQFAQELGIQAEDAGMGTFAGGQRAAVQAAMLDSLTLGGVTVSKLPINVLPTRNFKLHDDIQIDGIIGTELLSRFLSTIDYAHGALVLRSRSSAAAFEAEAAKSGAVRVPFWLVGDHFLFARGRLGDAPEGLFSIDTGLAGGGVTATEAALQAAHITPDTAHARSDQGGGGTITAVPFAADVSLGSVTEHGVQGLYTPEGSPYGIFPFQVQGAVSHGFFRPYALTFDFDAMQLVLQK